MCRSEASEHVSRCPLLVVATAHGVTFGSAADIVRSGPLLPSAHMFICIRSSHHMARIVRVSGLVTAPLSDTTVHHATYSRTTSTPPTFLYMTLLLPLLLVLSLSCTASPPHRLLMSSTLQVAQWRR